MKIQSTKTIILLSLICFFVYMALTSCNAVEPPKNEYTATIVVYYTFGDVDTLAIKYRDVTPNAAAHIRLSVDDGVSYIYKYPSESKRYYYDVKAANVQTFKIISDK